ncbi:MAG: hypothetical protein ACTSV2_16380, partial [Candidatus Thorarchaeota archaeon]
IPVEIAEELIIDGSSAYMFVSRDNLRTLLKSLGEVQFTNLDITSPDLEDIFLKYYDLDSGSNQEEKSLTSEGY